MAIKSKYSNEQVEALLNEVLGVLYKHEANAELSLMVLGDAVTHLINSNVTPAKREAIALQFGKALANSVNSN